MTRFRSTSFVSFIFPFFYSFLFHSLHHPTSLSHCYTRCCWCIIDQQAPTHPPSNPTPFLPPPSSLLYPIMLRTIKKKREKEKKEKRVERGWLRFDYAFHHHRLHMRSDSSFVFILIPFFGEGWGALLLSFMYVYAGLIYFRENKFQTKLKAAIIILLFSKK